MWSLIFIKLGETKQEMRKSFIVEDVHNLDADIDDFVFDFHDSVVFNCLVVADHVFIFILYQRLVNSI